MITHTHFFTVKKENVNVYIHKTFEMIRTIAQTKKYFIKDTIVDFIKYFLYMFILFNISISSFSSVDIQKSVVKFLILKNRHTQKCRKSNSRKKTGGFYGIIFTQTLQEQFNMRRDADSILWRSAYNYSH